MNDKNDKEWKKIFAEFLKKLKIIHDDFTGNFNVDIKQGGIVSAKRTENL